MQSVDTCPACGNGRQYEVYHVTSIAAPETPGKERFLLALVGKPHVELAYMLCTACLFMYFNPRFTRDENTRLYSLDYITKRAEHDPEYARLAELLEHSPQEVVAKLEGNESQRRSMIFDILKQSHQVSRIRSILDFGGGRGGNIPDLGPDVRRFVLDSVTQTAPGVGLVSGLHDHAPYDLIMCTHVLEHLPEPASMLADFTDALADGGLLYIEVPYDFHYFIRTRAGLNEHINFFTVTSLLNLFASAGYAPLYLKRHLYPYGDWTTHAICGLFARVPQSGGRRRWLSLGAEIMQMIVMRRLLRRIQY